MALGEYRPPNQINTDEDKYGYGKILFTKIQIVYALAGTFLGAAIFFLLNKTHLMLLQVLGVSFILVGLIGGVMLGGLTIPNNKYLNGGGLRIDLYLIRKIKKKFLKKKKVLYCHNIDRDKIVSYRSTGFANDTKKPGALQDLKSIFGGDR